MKKNSLKVKVWLYLALFSFVILFSIWVLQIMLLNTYYQYKKNGEISKVADQVVNLYNKNNFQEYLDNISYNKDVCIEILHGTEVLYTSGSVDRGCIFKNGSGNYKINFILSNEKKVRYNIINNNFKNKTLVYALKLDNNNNYAFISTSLQPMGYTVSVLKSQFFYVAIIVLVFSILIAYFISKKISSPIIKINNASRELAKGNFEANFDVGDSIEEIKELSNTLSQASKELSKTEGLRRELMANVSHDLKTPLTLIKANSEMVRDLTIKDEKKSKDTLNTIISEVDRLNLLVEDILDLSKMQSKVYELKKEKFDLNIVIREIIEKYKILEEKDGYKIIYNYKKEINIYADKKRIEQAIYNLINNAINYTGKNKKVYIEIEELNDSYKVSIRDTGNGIDSKDLDYIWDKYYKVDKSYKRVSHGTGLGLSIVKNIFIMHGYNYGVNTSKKGTTFYFEIKK